MCGTSDQDSTAGFVVFRFLSFYRAKVKADGSDRFWRKAAISGLERKAVLRRYTPIPKRCVLPIVFNIRISSFAAILIGLSVMSEVYRSGIQTVPKGHREAAQVLGLTPFQSFRRIVLPQAIRFTLPPLASNFVQLIKFSSLGAVISVTEITRRGMELSSSTFRPLEIFSFIAVVYFFICWPLSMTIRIWEHRLAQR